MDDNLDELHEKLLELKVAKDFKETIKNTKNLIKRDTQDIPSLDELNDLNKGNWVEHDEGNFAKMFEGLLDYCADEEEYDNLDWNTVNYQVYGADYYEEKFPGFSEEVYEILAKSTEEENKIIDNRIPPIEIKHGEFTVSFD
jgi:phage pi2 protein 07